jgi:hypothetical protein
MQRSENQAVPENQQCLPLELQPILNLKMIPKNKMLYKLHTQIPLEQSEGNTVENM